MSKERLPLKVGVIGTGNMGSILIRALVEAGAVASEHLVMTNRTLAKAMHIQHDYPQIQVAECPETVALETDVIFICVKPHDIHPLLQKINPMLDNEKIIVSITSPVSVEQLSAACDAQAVRMIPSITNRALAGVSLVTFADNVTTKSREVLLGLFRKFSEPILIDEAITRVASDIVSCGPAFISYLLQRFIVGAVNQTSITKEAATELTSHMMIGMGKLLEKQIFTLETLQEKVCVKGGITGEGIAVMEAEIGDVFDHLFQRTHAKYAEDKEKVRKQFGI